jgi:hypothetical protein
VKAAPISGVTFSRFRKIVQFQILSLYGDFMAGCLHTCGAGAEIQQDPEVREQSVRGTLTYSKSKYEIVAGNYKECRRGCSPTLWNCLEHIF